MQPERVAIKSDLLAAYFELSQRRLKFSVKWIAECLVCFSDVNLLSGQSSSSYGRLDHEETGGELDKYLLATSYMDLEEFQQAAFVTTSSGSTKQSKLNQFIHHYSRFLAISKDRTTEHSQKSGRGSQQAQSRYHPTPAADYRRSESKLEVLEKDLSHLCKNKTADLDPYCYWLHGCVLKKLGLNEKAVETLAQAINARPFNWAAWWDLSCLITEKQQLDNLSALLPDNWMKLFFLSEAYLQLQFTAEANHYVIQLEQLGFAQLPHLQTHRALLFNASRETELATKELESLFTTHPYRMDKIDVYSNLLYVQEKKRELAVLAQRCTAVDRYRPETCCVVGNYYSLRGQREEAVTYFQRALKLDPEYISAWTLMGHEFMELKNTTAAIHAYRSSLNITKNDYRCWYGLGQVYEILDMPHYSLYYFKEAQRHKPNDSRMLVALGDVNEKLDKLEDAKKLYWHAYAVGDAEGTALYKLGRLHARLDDTPQACAAYAKYINEVVNLQPVDSCCGDDEISHAYLYLAKYFLQIENLHEAEFAAHKCTQFTQTREQGRELLEEISSKRQKMPKTPVAPTAETAAPFDGVLMDGEQT